MLQSETKNVHVCYSDNIEERELRQGETTPQTLASTD